MLLAGTIATAAGIGHPFWAMILLGDVPPWMLLILIPALQFSVEFFVGRNYAIACIFITPLAIVLTYLAFPVPIESLMVDRIVETVIGVVIGMAVSVATYPLLRRSEARRGGVAEAWFSTGRTGLSTVIHRFRSILRGYPQRCGQRGVCITAPAMSQLPV